MELKFLYLSDLHFDKKNLKDIKIVLGALERDLGKLDEKIDYILFNGDLVKNGSYDESYKLAKENVILPILEITNLSENNILFAPGNHEVDRSAINQFVDGDLSDKFDDRDTLNSFFDTLDTNSALLVRLKKFHEFNEEFNRGTPYLKTKNPISSTYMLEKDGIKVGIACLNSSWCAFGGDSDNGKLLLGERQVDDAIDNLKDCDYRIAMFHHPVEWLKEFDRDSVYERLISGFNMVLTGHVHKQDYKEIMYDNSNTIFLKSSSLFQGRGYNGYSLINLNFSKNEVSVMFREYFDNSRKFGKAERIVDEGVLTKALLQKSESELVKRNISVRNTIRDGVSQDINKKLLSVASDSYAPKEIKEIFVPPILTTRPENSKAASDQILDEEMIDLSEILESGDNILFVGKKEMGKTTLLNYICHFYFEKYDKIKIPIVFDFDEIPKGKNVFQKVIHNFLINYDISCSDLEENLNQGNFIIIFDNFDLKNTKNIEKLKAFTAQFSNNRFIFAMKEDILQSLEVKKLPDIGFKYQTYYINAFRRKQIRELVNKWFTFKDINDDLVLDNVIKSMKQIGVPRSPMFVSLLLWILEKDSNFTPVNEASMVENFIEILLEKLNPDDAKYETTGYKIKIDFLKTLAKTMIKDNKYHIDVIEFEKVFTEYFNRIGLEIDFTLKETFFEKGVLLKNNGNVYFRFACFLEYFIALEMDEDKALFDFVINESNYLDFSNEISYYTGLNQKIKSYEILKIIEVRMLDAFKDINSLVDIQRLAGLPVKEVLADLVGDDNVTERIESMKIDDDKKDEILDDTESIDYSASHFKERKNRLKENFIHNLKLYSNVLRNCELVGKDLKVAALKISIEKYCILIGALYKVLEDAALEEIKLGNTDKKEEDLIYAIRMVVPLFIQGEMLRDLGSPKLKVVISKCIDEAESEFEKLLLVSMYGDLRLEGYITKYRDLFEGTESKLIKEIITIKLFHYQAFFTMSKYEQDQLVTLLSEVIYKKNNYRNKKIKNSIKQQLSKQDLLRKQRVAID